MRRTTPSRVAISVRALLLIGLLAQVGVRLTDSAHAQTQAATPVSTPAVPLCGVTDVSAVAQPAQPAPTNPVHPGPGGFTVSYMTIANGNLYVLDTTASAVRRYTLDGQPLGSVPFAFQLSVSNFAVDGTGSVYLPQYPATLVKLSPTGQTIWTRTGVAAQQIDGLFALGTSVIGVVGRGEQGAALFDQAGTANGRTDVTGSSFSPAPDGGVIATDGAYVRRYDAGGHLLSTFGDRRVANDPSPTAGPFHFYQQGGAVLLPDGTYYVADATRGIDVASANGYYAGLIDDVALGYLTERSAVAATADRLYFTAGGRFNGNQHVSWISLADAARLRSAPREPVPVLGYGAGVTTGAVGNFFPAGRTPTVTASFDPWWASAAATLRLQYTVRDRQQVTTAVVGTPITVALPTSATALADMPLSLPAAAPGSYEVDVRLVDAATGAAVGATCLNYTVGAASHRLDFTSLPPGADYGGPRPARGVALADQLGTGDFRGVVDWARLLPDPSGPMHFEAYDSDFRAAAQEAVQRGVIFHVQVGQAGPVEMALVQNGTWGSRVQELVAHFAGVVSAWEAWNEPNITFGAADAYVNQILRPFAQAVHAADPAARVIGGSVVGMDLGYYDRIGLAGGFGLLDVVAIHPYTGHNRSWEEDGTPAAIGGLKQLIARYGPAKPVWITEAAWWSDGPGNYLSQADKLARAMVWSRALGIERWNYFMMEGGYGDYGFTYSLIETGAQPDDYVKPGALAAMTAAAQTRGRALLGMVDTGLPHATGVMFGPAPGATDSVLAVWTDDAQVPANLTVPGATSAMSLTITDLLGATTTTSASATQPAALRLSGSPQYISVPAGVQVQVGPTEAFGTNLASAGTGATATASSNTSTNPAGAAIDGVSDAQTHGDIVGLSAWASAPGDARPTLTVQLANPAQINRVMVSTHSIGSVVPGLRSYTVEVQDVAGAWAVVGQIRDEFFQRRNLVWFGPRTVRAVRISTTDVDFSGLAGGVRPWFWPSDAANLSDPRQTWYGPAVIYELEAYAGSSALPGESPSSPPTSSPPTSSPSTSSPSTSSPPTTQVPPPAPTGLTVAPGSSRQLSLSWTPTPSAQSYKVERSTDGVRFTVIATGVGANAYTDVGLPSCSASWFQVRSTYWYRVRATNAAGDSAPSAAASGTTWLDARQWKRCRAKASAVAPG